MKRFLIFSLLLFPLATLAQAPAPAASIWDDPMILFYVVVGFMFVVALLVLVVALYLLQVVSILAEKAEKERAEKLGITFKPEPSLLNKLWDKLNDFVPVEKEAEIVLDHNYDGIKELDNHLPPWWRWLFYVTMIFAVVYLLVFHVFNTLPLSVGEYENEVAYANAELLRLKAANPGPVIDEATVEATDDVKMLADGKATFLNTCSTCHRRDGGGDIGPNLTDQYWKHGGSIKNLFKVVKDGVPGTNMVAWGGVMSPEAMRNVTSYVLTLQGSNPVNPKKPEGDLYKPESKPVKADTTKTQATL
jgi:cytochrome c oxidase cbb3-type subunit 3